VPGARLLHPPPRPGLSVTARRSSLRRVEIKDPIPPSRALHPARYLMPPRNFRACSVKKKALAWLLSGRVGVKVTVDDLPPRSNIKLIHFRGSGASRCVYDRKGECARARAHPRRDLPIHDGCGENSTTVHDGKWRGRT